MPIDKGLAGLSAEELAQVKLLLLPIVAAPLFARVMALPNGEPSDMSLPDCAEIALESAQALLDAWGKRL